MELTRTGPNRVFILDNGSIKRVPFVGPELPLAAKRLMNPGPLFPRLWK